MTQPLPRRVEDDEPEVLARALTVAAGIIDVGASSAATFVCGLLAVRLLTAHVLGAYALAFRVLVLAMTVPWALIFQTREVQAMRVPERDRLRLFLPGARVGVPIAIWTSLLAALWPLTFPGGVPPQSIWALNVTMCAVAVLSPLQDFFRRLLHLSGRSWDAARVSVTHLGIVLVGWVVVAMGYVRVPEAWLPFGLLASANALSLLVGMRYSRSALTAPAPVLPDRERDLLRTGMWLLLVGLLSSATNVIAGIVIARISGPDTLGYLEAARVVAQPVLVFTLGLSAVLAPQLMRAAQTRQRNDARRLAWQFSAAIAVVGLMYALVFGIRYPGNVLALLIPKAFIVPGVVMLTIVAQITVSLASPQRSQLLGAGWNKTLAGVEAISNSAIVGCAFLASVVGIFALPIGTLSMGLIRLLLLRHQTTHLYASPEAPLVPLPAGLSPATSAAGRGIHT
jgi:O-antigen/teichoic acid export membrane protein